MNKWGKRSKANYVMLHPDLQILADEVLEQHDCSLIQSFREKEIQDKYFARGTSKVKWPGSKHNRMPSQAMDLAPHIPGDDPYDHENVLRFAGIVISTANRLYKSGLMAKKLKWGGTWSEKLDAPFAFDENRFYDGIHFELV